MDDQLTRLTYDFDSTGTDTTRTINRVRGLETDPFWRDVVWESYSPQGVEILNPRSGQNLSLKDTGEQKFGFGVWSVQQKDPSLTAVGEVHVLFLPRQIATSYFEIDPEFRGQGIAQAVAHWLGLKAYRENKSGYCQDLSPQEVIAIANSMYRTGYCGYSTDYGTTFDAPIDAEKVARHQRMDWLIHLIQVQAEKTPRPELRERLFSEIRADDPYRKELISRL